MISKSRILHINNYYILFLACYALFSARIIVAEDNSLLKDRWIIDVRVDKSPAFFTYTNPDNSSENYFYFILTLKFDRTFLDEYQKNTSSNVEEFIRTIDKAPLQYLNIQLIAPKVVKVLTKTGENGHNTYDYEYNDLILTSVINRKVEYKILENLLKIKSYPLKEKIKTIKNKKRMGQLLNINELRFIKKHISKGESVSVLLYFKNFPLKATSFKILVTGIVDPIFTAQKKLTDISDIANVSSLVHIKTHMAAELEKKALSIKRFEIENRYLVIAYDFPGDPYERHLDMPKYKESKIFSKKIGGATDIQTFENLLNTLTEDKISINKITSFNLLTMLLPIEIFPDCLIHKDEKELRYSTKEEALNSKDLKCITKARSEIIELANKFKQDNRLEKLEIPNLKMRCLKESFDDLCTKELKFNWLKFKDKIAFDPSTYTYEIMEQ